MQSACLRDILQLNSCRDAATLNIFNRILAEIYLLQSDLFTVNTRTLPKIYVEFNKPSHVVSVFVGMTSICNTGKSVQSWQQLMADCLEEQPLYQRQDNDVSPRTTASNKVYWVDDLSVPTPSSSPWQYHTALAIGATMVCSAGAVMQYAETGFWHQSDDTVSDAANTVSGKQAESDVDAQVATPPITSPQTKAAHLFSSNTKDASGDCKDSTCKGLAFIDQQVPQIQDQVRKLRTEMQLFQAKHTTQNLQTHRTVLAYRGNDLARKQAELLVRSQQLDQKFSDTTAILALHQDEIIYLTNLLQTDAQYQTQLQQLKTLENDIAVEFSEPDLDNTQLQELYAAYYQSESQLRQTAQSVLSDYIYATSLESPDPLWQEASYIESLQELIDLSHQNQMLVMEQQTLDLIATKLSVRRTELASLLRQYAAMQRELDGHNQVLQQYVAKRQALKSELT